MLTKQAQSPYLKLSQSFAGALSQLKSSLIEAANGKTIKSIMVTSSKPREGKTLAAISIAKTLAKGQEVKVLLIDVNFKSPMLHEVFNTPKQPGLSDMVLNQASKEETCFATSITNLDVLANGQQQNTEWVFDSNNFAKSLNALSQDYDYIVVDTNSLLGSSEASLICPLFDAILLVVECEVTKWQVANAAAEKINKAGGNLLGTVMNRRKFYLPRFFYG
jgi:capsular exopolysaccharide synthesis family protein